MLTHVVSRVCAGLRNQAVVEETEKLRKDIDELGQKLQEMENRKVNSQHCSSSIVKICVLSSCSSLMDRH